MNEKGFANLDNPANSKLVLEPLQGEVDAVAITSVFAPVSARHELAAADIAREIMGPDVHLSLSHELGALGILERVNITHLSWRPAPNSGAFGPAVYHARIELSTGCVSSRPRSASR